jgi:DNA-binding beta-propeller fold protein YncE
VAAWFAPAAFGADSVYWADGGSSSIRVGNLDGSGSASDLFTGETHPEGVVIDPAAGKIYWADSTNAGAIRVANLDGTGSPSNLFAGEGYPGGVAIDPAKGKIYWTDNGSTVRVGNLDGSGSAATLFSGETSPYGVAIDPAAGKIYWGQYASPGAIRVGNLDGSGSAASLFPLQGCPLAVALDPATGKMYWGLRCSGAVRVGNLDGSGSYSTLFGSESGAAGVAIDPTAGKIYWTDDTSSGAIRVGNLDGSGSASDLFPGEVYPNFLALLRAPVGTGVPAITGGSSAGSTLSCTQGSWASDLLGAFLYRAPQTYAYQWTYNGVDIVGATSSTYVAPSGGSYACRVTASNQAGSTAQVGAAFTVTGAGTPPPTMTTATLKLSNMGQSHRRWREGSGLPHIASARPPVGTTFAFALNESARVQFVFKQWLPGRRVNGRCVAPTAKNGNKPKCSRLVTRGTLSFSVGAGSHKLRFQGRLAKHMTLPPGRYTLAITATNATGQRGTAELTFTIVAG